MKIKKLNKKAQEEIVGFVLIIIIVAIALLFMIGFSLRSDNEKFIESYEANSFLQAMLQHTSSCRQDYSDYKSIRELISLCEGKKECENNKDSCEVLEKELREILDNSWKVGEDWPEKGYNLTINSETGKIIEISKGNSTLNYKGSVQEFSKSGKMTKIELYIYY